MAVTYLTPGEITDPYSGLPVGEDWESPTRTDAPTAFVLSAATDKANDGTSATVTLTWTLFVPEGEISPGPSDRVEFDGQVFSLDGKPIREVNPFTGWAPYAQVRIERAEGA